VFDCYMSVFLVLVFRDYRFIIELTRSFLESFLLGVY
jgi:hypothetical protein